MSEALDRLKNLGAQKIYEDTHIPINQVQAILYENFDGMTKVQFVGFVSILEREYNEDLRETKERGIAYFDEQKSRDDAEYAERIFVDPSAQKKKIVFVFLLAFILLLIAIYFTINSDKISFNNLINQENKTEVSSSMSSKEPEKKSPDTAFVELNTTVEQNTTVTKLESNTTAEKNTTEELLTANKEAIASTPAEDIQKKEEKAAPSSLKILPKTKVWLGYIDVKTNKKYQKTVRKELSLDPAKEWLLLFGHGNVTVAVDDKKYKFSKKNTLRLHYKDGKISKISQGEFKRLNRGRKW